MKGFDKFIRGTFVCTFALIILAGFMLTFSAKYAIVTVLFAFASNVVGYVAFLLRAVMDT